MDCKLLYDAVITYYVTLSDVVCCIALVSDRTSGPQGILLKMNAKLWLRRLNATLGFLFVF